MELNLKNPIIFFDLETTGVDVSKDHIVRYATLRCGQMETRYRARCV